MAYQRSTPYPAERNRRRTSGFTLVEVLAALAIFAVAAFVLLDAHYTALNLHTMVDEEVTLRQFVESTAAKAEVELLAGRLSGGGDFGMRYPDYSWTFTASPVGQDETDLLYLVHVTITGPGEARDLEFYSYDTGVGDEDKEGGSSGGNRSGSGASEANSGSRSNRSGDSDAGASGRSGSFGNSGSNRSGRGGSGRNRGTLFN